nr:immunoglobulin heavy chain junction region [Macaca mulatta]MOW93391.1 immunoglobulin heavy chain junction region [Macaca mulatta]MOW93729.1 immunoglobulin heavy chain junction region [Macaca mulatta]MOW93776.1 immunoglobulin heavy chain junction region [Macaca mulatta]MOW93944.1 immunoglobulin heavy chain junction region [Macaca mulatta]
CARPVLLWSRPEGSSLDVW